MESEQSVEEIAAARASAALPGLVRRSRRVIWIILAVQSILLAGALVTVGILIAAYIHVQDENHRLSGELSGAVRTIRSALCDGQHAIGTVNPPPQTTRVGVEFIESFREGFVRLGCQGHLGPPSKALIHLGAKYQISIRY